MHVAATWDGATIKLYINGVQEGSSLAFTGPIATNTLPLGFGVQGNLDLTRLYQGLIDDARLYNRALSLAEIQALANVGPPILTAITVTPASPTIAAGTDQQFTATGLYTDGSRPDISASVTWSSATPAVATIIATGRALGVAAGTSMISATLGAVTDSTLLTVGPPILTAITVTPASPTIAAGTDQQFTATGRTRTARAPTSARRSPGARRPRPWRRSAPPGAPSASPRARA